MIVDDRYWQARDETAFDREQLQEIYLRLNNGALRDLPADLRVSTHVCRGNYHSTWAAQGGYAPVAATLFAKRWLRFTLNLMTTGPGTSRRWLKCQPASRWSWGW